MKNFNFAGSGPIKTVNYANLVINFPIKKKNFYIANNKNYLVIMNGFFF